MGKRGSLFDEGAAGTEKAPEPEASTRAPTAKRGVAKSREGKRNATVYLSEEAHLQLGMISLKERTSIQDLLVEGINAVFATRGLSRIA